MNSCDGCRYLQRERTAEKGKVFLRCMRRTDESGKPWIGYGRVIEKRSETEKVTPERPAWCEKRGGYRE